MGNCLYSPHVGNVLSSEEVDNLLKTQLNPTNIQLPDRKYFCTDTKDIVKFLATDRTNFHRYKAEVFDCDDFAHCLYSEIRKWIAGTSIKMPLLFGYVHGDIRSSEDDDTPRPHAVNFFVDNDMKLWLIEPQSDKIFEPTSNSTFWYVYC